MIGKTREALTGDPVRPDNGADVKHLPAESAGLSFVAYPETSPGTAPLYTGDTPDNRNDRSEGFVS